MRSCIFCGLTPVTKEDGWPVWLVNHVGRGRLRVTRGSGANARTHMSDRIVQRVSCACRECNNGWMSNTEALTKPILSPMADGLPSELTGLSQAILSVWAVKTLMVFDSIGDSYWRQDERDLLRRDHGALISKCIAVAADYSGTWKATAQPKRQRIARLSGEATEIPSFRGILQVGRVILRVDADRYQESTGRVGWALPGPHYDKTILLGGPASATQAWPPPESLDDRMFLEFSGKR